jgi:hypothetical protein
MAWFTRFVDPIVVPDGRELLTLRDAAEYITALPKAEHDAADFLGGLTTAIASERRLMPVADMSRFHSDAITGRASIDSSAA